MPDPLAPTKTVPSIPAEDNAATVEPTALNSVVAVGDGGLGTATIALPAAEAVAAETGQQVIGRTARAAVTWISTALYTVVTLAVAFVTTPLLLKYLGEERLGAYRAASEWIGYVSLIDLGITAALGVLVLRARTIQSKKETVAVIRGGLLVLTVVALVTAAPAIGLAMVMPRLVPVAVGLQQELIVSTLFIASLVLFLPFQMSRLILEAEQRGYRVSMAYLGQAVVAAVLSVVLAQAGLGLVAQSLALIVGTAVATILCLIPTWRWYVAQPRAADKDDVSAKGFNARGLWRLSWPLALSNVGIRLNGMTDSIVVGYMLGPIAVFHLFVTQRMVSLFGSQVNSLSNASWAALASLRMTGQQNAYVSRILELTELTVGLGVALTGTVAASNREFVFLWVGSGNYGGDLLSYLTAATSILSGVAILYGYSLDSAGETAKRIPVSIAGAVGNLFVSIALVKYLGLPGVLLGTVIASSLSDVWFCPLQVSRLFGVPGFQIAWSAARGFLRALPWTVVTAIGVRVFPSTDWRTFVIRSAIIGLLSLAYAWQILLRQDDRVRWKTRIALLFSGLKSTNTGQPRD